MKKRGKAKHKGKTNRPAAVARYNNQAPASAVVTRRNGAAIAYPADDRRALGLLLLPVLMVALFLSINHALKPVGRWIEASRAYPVPTAIKEPGNAAIAHLSTIPALPSVALHIPIAVIIQPGRIELPPLELPKQAPGIAFAPVVERPVAQVTGLIVPPVPFALPSAVPDIDVLTQYHERSAPQVASLIVPPAPFSLPSKPPAISLLGSRALPEVCLPTIKQAAMVVPILPAEFGNMLAAAAKAQTKDFVIYNATYKRIAYPMGDIPSLYGSCSDVIIRAYRSLGIDLQVLVQRARVGSGDPNIDHRRTETLRAFFSRHGEIIPVSNFPEDYKPGDIVTYYRPFSRVSRAHIAIVSDEIGPSGRPLIIHNRGWGPQLEDALFVDRVTGHYRFSGISEFTHEQPYKPRRIALPNASQSSDKSWPERVTTSSNKSRRTGIAPIVQ